VGQTDLTQTKIEDKYKDLKKTKEIKFGGGDVWGTTYIFNNTDSSIVKVLVEYDAGDYGRGQNEYIVDDHRLIYQRDSIVDWLIVKSPLDSNKYKLRETICYFNADSTGTKTSRAVYSMTFNFDENKKTELRNKTVDSVTLTKLDYVKLVDELRNALERRVIEE
jgi:hypothetical protein